MGANSDLSLASVTELLCQETYGIDQASLNLHLEPLYYQLLKASPQASCA